jgi:hypothetical protein
VVVDTADGARLVEEVPVGDERALRSVPIGGGDAVDLGSIPDGLALEAGEAFADSATELAAGWVLLAPEGRMPADGSDTTSRLRHVPDGTTLPLTEVTR